MAADHQQHRNQVRDWYSTGHELQRWGTVEGGICGAEAELLQRHMARPGRVLNVGCGGGREALPLAQMGHEVVALDLMPQFLCMARDATREACGGLSLIQADALSIPFADCSFDYVVMVGQLIDQINRREQRLDCLRGLARLLRPGGLLLASTNNIESRLRFRAFFGIINLLRRVYNPRGLEPDDAHVFHVDGRWALLRPRSERPLHHWYRPALFVRDLAQAGFEQLELLPCDQSQHAERGTGCSEIFYVAKRGT
ncbi:MAG: class I SAM-dependent methyltransferase [Candidatus Alcyoniella australis]|nr:class I SAM-dependent methyltransferase [Candidatus Alcyoniella australis]